MAQHDDKAAARLHKELAKYDALDQSEIDQVISELLASPKGGKFLWWLLQVSKYGVNPFSPDATVMAFQAGESNIGSQILARIVDVNAMGFARLQMERKQESDRRVATATALAGGAEPDLFNTGDADDSAG